MLWANRPCVQAFISFCPGINEQKFQPNETHHPPLQVAGNAFYKCVTRLLKLLQWMCLAANKNLTKWEKSFWNCLCVCSQIQLGGGASSSTSRDVQLSEQSGFSICVNTKRFISVNFPETVRISSCTWDQWEIKTTDVICTLTDQQQKQMRLIKAHVISITLRLNVAGRLSNKIYKKSRF